MNHLAFQTHYSSAYLDRGRPPNRRWSHLTRSVQFDPLDLTIGESLEGENRRGSTSLISKTRIALSVWVLTRGASCRGNSWGARCGCFGAAACRTRLQQGRWSLHWAAACPQRPSGPAPLLRRHQAEMGAAERQLGYMLSQLRVVAEEQLWILRICQVI